MKKISFIFLSCICTCLLFSQEKEIKVKKDIVYLDGTPVVKMIGKCGVFTRLNYTFISLKGDTLFTMKDNFYKYSNPYYGTTTWFDINFLKLKKQLMLIREHTLVNDKQVVKYVLLTLNPFIIKDGELDTSAVAQVIQKQDYRNTFIADTTYKLGFDRKKNMILDKSYIKRDINKPIIVADATIHPELKGFNNYKLYEIQQDKVLIGLIVEVNGMETTSRKISYYFLRKLNEPMEYQGEHYPFVMVALIDDSFQGFLVSTYKKESMFYTAPQNSTNKFLDYAKHLVDIKDL